LGPARSRKTSRSSFKSDMDVRWDFILILSLNPDWKYVGGGEKEIT
jgi:hypothetical protein